MRGRYDGVVHLVTAADGAPEHYKYGVVEDDSGGQVCGLRAQQWTASPCLSVLLRAPSRRSIPHAVQPVHSLSTCVLCLHAYPPYPRAYQVYRRETPTEAIEIDRKLQAAWAAHAGHVIVGSHKAQTHRPHLPHCL